MQKFRCRPATCVGVVERNEPADDAAPVAALHAVALVAEPRHQLGDDRAPSSRDCSRARAGLPEKPKPGSEDRDDIEGILGAAAVLHRVGQRPDDFGELDERSRPAMGDRSGKAFGTFDCWWMKWIVEPSMVGLELIEFVQLALLCAPVEPVAPVGDERLQIGEVGAVVPAGSGNLIRKAGAGEPRLEIAQRLVRNLNLEGHDGVATRAGGARGGVRRRLRGLRQSRGRAAQECQEESA